MSRVELLCPAGSFEAFEAALYNGADAIFLAGKMYGARASASNFEIDEIKRAVQLAHLYGVKIHVTLNTLIHDHELKQCKSYIQQLSDIGVDALIVQDLGIMDILRHEFPQIEIHASTQMHIHNLEGIKQCKQWGLARCVVARESNLDQIREFCQQGIEIEVFVQGAYCVSYSGECHMSNQTTSRSANRGECSQNCRMPYELWQDSKKIDTEGKYLLSLKDLSAVERIPVLIDCGVSSFKIEGRMKRPEYVACMCRVYRKAIDAYENHEEFHLTKEIQNEMMKVFNRGFTSGYLDKKQGLSMMSTLRPNHQGIRIGKVIGFHHDKMSIQLEKELSQHDGIRILNKKEDQGFIVNYLYKDGQLVSHASGGIIELQRVKANVGDIVMKTSDSHQLNELSKSISDKNRKVAVSIEVLMRKDQPVVLKMKDDRYSVEVVSEQVCEQARSVALSEERVSKQVSKLGNTPFICQQVKVDIEENLSFPISLLNELRRQACDALLDKCMNQEVMQVEKKAYTYTKPILTHQIRVQVSTLQQARVALNYPVEVYAPSFICEQLEGVHLSYPRVYHGEYEQMGEIFDVGGLKCKGIASGYMNCMNAYTANVMFNEGISCVGLSFECSDDEIGMLVSEYRKLTSYDGNFEVCLYGRMENMVLENCIIMSQLHTKKHCQLCHEHDFYLKDFQKKEYPLRGDENCRMKVYHCDILNRLNKKEKYEQRGVSNFLLSFTFENEDEVKNVLDCLFG